MNPPFICSFDAYTQLGNNICNGISYEASKESLITSLEIDPLASSPSTYITDFTSIAGKTQSNKICSIPFSYKNESSNFCIADNSQFICQVEPYLTSDSYDVCKLGKTFICIK